MVEESAVRGAGNVTVAHVVASAGVSRRTFYELFSDREDCFLAAFEEGVARVTRRLLDYHDPGAEWAERIRASLIALLSFLDSDRATGRLLLVDSLGGGARALERRQQVLAQIVHVIDEGRLESKSASALPPFTAEGIAGGMLSVLHSRLLESSISESDRRSAGSGSPESRSLLDLTGPLMGMIVLPYLGPAAARRENARPTPKIQPNDRRVSGNPLGRLDMRLTYRTVRVLMAIASHTGSSNRAIARLAEVSDQGQMSKLLTRLQGLGLIHNVGGAPGRGEPNAWTLTERGWEVHGAIADRSPNLPAL
jgi:AcrR family transcriptional regulator